MSDDPPRAPAPAAGWNSLFSDTYAQARNRFLKAGGGAVQSHVEPGAGRSGEALATDVLRVGPANARRVLLISSACHGVEGFCGSGAQLALLADADLLAHAAAQDVALLFVHALNPHGFSHGRRVTQEGADLNRNFHDFTAPLPANPGHDELAPYLVPDEWPPSAANEAQLAAYATAHGERALQTAISSGQHRHPLGLFYGGIAPTWSHRTIRHLLREHGSQCERFAWLDLHTGLGPNGVGERIFAGDGRDAAALGRARAWWGSGVTSIHDGSSTSAPLTGLMWTAAAQECPQAEITGVALEFGTEPFATVLQALRADHWLAAHPNRPAQVPADIAESIHADMRRAFYTDTDAWKSTIVAQTVAVTREAVDGLAGA